VEQLGLAVVVVVVVLMLQAMKKMVMENTVEQMVVI
jgi:hypothetical protein